MFRDYFIQLGCFKWDGGPLGLIERTNGAVGMEMVMFNYFPCN